MHPSLFLFKAQELFGQVECDPMKILIIETSCEKGCLVLAEDATPTAFKALPGGPSLSKSLAFEVKKFLDGQTPDLIALGTGPGSFTGIRVGAALAKALSYGWKVPLIGFCSLKAFGPGPVLVDARMGGFYALIGEKPTLISPSDPSLQNLPSISSPHPQLIQKRLASPALWREAEPDPRLLAELVYQQFLEEKLTPLELTYAAFP